MSVSGSARSITIVVSRPSRPADPSFVRKNDPIHDVGDKRVVHKMSKAKDIVDQLISKYNFCGSYSDEGYVEATGIYQFEFKTHFVRPQKIRLDWFNSKCTGRQTAIHAEISAIFRDGRRLLSLPEAIKQDWTVQKLLSSASGISQGVAFVVPSLLLPEVGFSNSFSELLTNHRETIEYTDGKYAVAGSRNRLRFRAIIDENAFLRQAELQSSNDFLTVYSYTKIELNSDIEEKVFEMPSFE